MVDVSSSLDCTGSRRLDVQGCVLIPSSWLAAHRLMDNLELSCAFDELLESKKLSHRVVGEMLLDLENSVLPDWVEFSWLLLDLRARSITGLIQDEGSVLYVYCGDKILGRVNGSRYSVALWNVYDNFRNGSEELSYNKEMKQTFFRGYPLRLVSMHPRHEVTVGIPVVSNSAGNTNGKSGAIAEMYAHIAKQDERR